jgi:hypothetical protein
MRLLLILLLAAWIGVAIGCNKGESYKTRTADPAAADPGALITDDPAMGGGAPAEAAKPAGEGSQAKPAGAAEAKPEGAAEAKPEAPAEKK